MNPEQPLKIGTVTCKNSLMLAPMAGWSDSPFRQLCLESGCGCVFTEMISAEGLIRNDKKSSKLMKFTTSEKPIGIQLFGHRPETMKNAAIIARNAGADFIDINMGCPAKKIIRNNQGFALLENPELAKKIVCATVQAVSIPVTIKIRIGSESPSEEIKFLVKQCANLGIAAVIVHARTKNQRFSGEPHLDWVQDLKQMIPIPVIGNGGITDNVTAQKFITKTGCDGLMIGTASLGNPWIFREILHNKPAPHPLDPDRLKTLKQTVLNHLDLMINSFGEYLGIIRFRKHFVRYSKHLPGAKEIRQKALTLTDRHSLGEVMDQFFSRINGLSL